MEYKSLTDEESKIENKILVTMIENVPCKVSYKTSPIVIGTDNAYILKQEIVLYLAEDIKIYPGSVVEVTKAYEDICLYKCSGKAKRYSTHQEIALDLFSQDT